MAIRFYRAFTAPIEVISFDLDDTLYYNEDVIQNAELAQFQAVSKLLPNHQGNVMPFWLGLKGKVAKAYPELCHDVTLWRQMVIKTGLVKLGVAESELEQASQHIFDEFYAARSDFEVPKQTFDVLTKLRQKWPLIAVTNGNVDVNRVGLADYFVGYFRSGENQTRMKPHPDMLHLASKRLDIKLEHILHVGDNEFTDVGAANRAGCQSLWFNPEHRPFKGRCLPDAEYSDLDDLLQLL